MNIPIKTDFQPSGATLRKWLSTRKQPLNIGTGNIPGFFSDSGNSEDTNWFIVAVIGEIIGLGTTVFAGVRSGGIFYFLPFSL